MVQSEGWFFWFTDFTVPGRKETKTNSFSRIPSGEARLEDHSDGSSVFEWSSAFSRDFHVNLGFCTTIPSFQAEFHSYHFTSFIFNNRYVCKCIHIYVDTLSIFLQYLQYMFFETCFMTWCMPWSVIMKTKKVIHLLVQVAKQLSSVAFCGPLHPGKIWQKWIRWVIWIDMTPVPC